MSKLHDNNAAGNSPEDASPPKIHSLLRWFVAAFSVAIPIIGYIGREVSRSINGYYFKDYSSPPIGVAEIIGGLVSLYFLLVAISGRWRLYKASRRK